ncbi:MAG: hypothetical protein WB523_12585 [Candidatus Sulfotelmatobacter sp.]
MLRIFQSRIQIFLALIFICGLTDTAYSVSKPHLITFRKWSTVPWSPGSTTGEKPFLLKVRPLLVDSRIKEFTIGPAHDVTDRLFVVRRAFRVNDGLPQESASPPRWQWQRGGWLLVDRITGHISPVYLPEFDVFYSDASWYRDYAAYCGVSEDGKKVYAVVAQISLRKPVLKNLIDGESVAAETKDASPDSACATPAWQRTPIRVTFEPAAAAKLTFAIHGHIVDLITEEEDEGETTK